MVGQPGQAAGQSQDSGAGGWMCRSLPEGLGSEFSSLACFNFVRVQFCLQIRASASLQDAGKLVHGSAGTSHLDKSVPQKWREKSIWTEVLSMQFMSRGLY